MGVVIATDRADEFGVPTTFTACVGSPFRYTGEPLDASGLTYLRARHYDPTIGRFMTRDPFAGFARSPLSLNRYSYVENNPATLSDPSGHCLFLCAAVGAVIGGFVGSITYAATAGSDFSLGGLAGSVALSAATGAIIGFTGGVAAGAVAAGALTVAEGTVLVGTAGYATGLFTSGVQKAMGKPVTAGSVFWNVAGGVTGGVIGGPATAPLLSNVTRRLLTSVFSIGKGIAASTASASSSAGSASSSGSPVRSGSRVLGK